MNTPNPIPSEELARAERAAIRQAQALGRRLPYLIDKEQLEVEALVGVHRAAEEFRRERGASFATWAVTVVQRSMLEEARRQNPWTRLQRKERRESLEQGREPEGWMLPAVTLNTPAHNADERGDTLETTLPGPDVWEGVENRLTVQQLLLHLEPRRREVVERYYYQGQSSQEIAVALGVSVSRVQQLRMQAEELLKIAAGVLPPPETKRKQTQAEAAKKAAEKARERREQQRAQQPLKKLGRPALSPEEKRRRQSDRARERRARKREEAGLPPARAWNRRPEKPKRPVGRPLIDVPRPGQPETPAAARRRRSRERMRARYQPKRTRTASQQGATTS